ncbi:hypothetical protein, partial [Neisseria sicca]|uniref:hypothetical protein n=1 Tax=Neisseria sicca TaxID=490 RepID=UPI001C98FE6C
MERWCENEVGEEVWFYGNERGNLVDSGGDRGVIGEVHREKEGFSEDKFVVDKGGVGGVGSVVGVVGDGEVR